MQRGGELKKERRPNRGLMGGESKKGCLHLLHYTAWSPAGQKALIKAALAGIQRLFGEKESASACWSLSEALLVVGSSRFLQRGEGRAVRQGCPGPQGRQCGDRRWVLAPRTHHPQSWLGW